MNGTNDMNDPTNDGSLGSAADAGTGTEPGPALESAGGTDDVRLPDPGPVAPHAWGAPPAAGAPPVPAFPHASVAAPAAVTPTMQVAPSAQMAPSAQVAPTARGGVGTRALRARRVPRRVAVLVLTGGVVAGALLGTGWHFLTLTPPVPASEIVQE